MVWFQCEDCGDTLKKPKVKGHAGQCSASRFSCVDCLRVFDKWSVQGHTSCVSEHEKYALAITKPGQEHLMSAVAANVARGGGPVGAAGAIAGAEFLAEGPPWDCACCKVKCTSRETLLGHAQGKKHRSKSRTALAAMGKGLDGQPLPKSDGEKRVEEEKEEKKEAEKEEAEKPARKSEKKMTNDDNADEDASDSSEKKAVKREKREKKRKKKREKESDEDTKRAKRAKKGDGEKKEKKQKKQK